MQQTQDSREQTGRVGVPVTCPVCETERLAPVGPSAVAADFEAARRLIGHPTMPGLCALVAALSCSTCWARSPAGRRERGAS